MNMMPCTIGTRHKWEWLKNISVGNIVYTSSGTHGRFTLKGLYECQCGQKKHGQPNHDGGDLRSVGVAA